MAQKQKQVSYTPPRMHKHSVDILLMPHSVPTPVGGPLFPKNQVDLFHKHLAGLASLYSRVLGIPAVMVNKCGPWDSSLPGLPFLSQHSSFPGLTTVVDSDGVVKAQLGNAPGIVVEDVALDPTKKSS